MQSGWFAVQSLNYTTARHYKTANLVVYTLDPISKSICRHASGTGQFDWKFRSGQAFDGRVKTGEAQS